MPVFLLRRDMHDIADRDFLLLRLGGDNPFASGHKQYLISNSRSARMFLYELCRKALSAPFDDPFIALDAAGVAKIDAILGTKPFLAFV